MEEVKNILDSQEFKDMWLKMHTPWIRRHPKVGRNEICPFCDSGKKYKNCECSKIYVPPYTINHG